MNARVAPDDMALASDFARRVKSEFPDARVLLYGSRARCDAHADSDHDILVLLDERTRVEEDRVSEIARDFLLEGRPWPSVLTTRKETFEIMPEPVWLLILNINKDGVEIP